MIGFQSVAIREMDSFAPAHSAIAAFSYTEFLSPLPARLKSCLKFCLKIYAAPRSLELLRVGFYKSGAPPVLVLRECNQR